MPNLHQARVSGQLRVCGISPYPAATETATFISTLPHSKSPIFCRMLFSSRCMSIRNDIIITTIMMRPFSRLISAPKLRVAVAHRRFISSEITAKTSDPLRILFCGSDAFSCESLRALHREHERNAQLIESLDVMVLPPRRTGRGFKDISEGKRGVSQ